jgi:hypothetical protein
MLKAGALQSQPTVITRQFKTGFISKSWSQVIDIFKTCSMYQVENLEKEFLATLLHIHDNSLLITLTPRERALYKYSSN